MLGRLNEPSQVLSANVTGELALGLSVMASSSLNCLTCPSLQLRWQSLVDCDPVAKLDFARHILDVICDIAANSLDFAQSNCVEHCAGYPDNRDHSAVCDVATAFYAGAGNRELSNRIDVGFVAEAEITGRMQGIVYFPWRAPETNF